MKLLTKRHIHTLLKPRRANSHKGDHGHALIIAGDKGRMGAAVIASRACLRTGAGLLSVNVPQGERMILQIRIPEAMLMMREETDYDFSGFSALAVGPAFGTEKESFNILTKIITVCKIPFLLDADALNILSVNKDFFDQIPAGTILTPHPKEFDRLFGAHKNEEERRNTAIKYAKEKNIVIVLKGHHTLITSGKNSFLNTTGNSGLAKGGSGDALTGIITSFLAQGYESFNAAKLGVYIHGLAANIALKKQSPESMLITDVIECLGAAFKKISVMQTIPFSATPLL